MSAGSPAGGSGGALHLGFLTCHRRFCILDRWKKGSDHQILRLSTDSGSVAKSSADTGGTTPTYPSRSPADLNILTSRTVADRGYAYIDPCSPYLFMDTSWMFLLILHHNHHHLSLIGPLPHRAYHLPLHLPPLTAMLHTLNYLTPPCLHRHNFSTVTTTFLKYSLSCVFCRFIDAPTCFCSLHSCITCTVLFLYGDEPMCCIWMTYRHIAVPRCCFCSYYYIHR